MPKIVEKADRIKVPGIGTLRKYGLSETDWLTILDRQGGKCGACGRVPRTLRLVTDHEHVRGWKKMKGPERAKYVRGLLCWTCNHYRLARGAAPENLLGAANYLIAYQERREAEERHAKGH